MGRVLQIRIDLMFSTREVEKMERVKSKSGMPIFIVLAILLLSACGKSSQFAQAQPTSTTHIIQTALTKAPTVQSQPTIGLNQAILGGSIHAFDQKFGANNCCYRNEWTPLNGPNVGVWDESYNGLNVDETSMNRVVRIYIEPQGSDVWNASTSANICNRYLPPDFKYQSNYTVPLGNLTSGLVKVYYSTLLANTLPVHDFIGKDGKQGKPGTIYVFFNYSYDLSTVNIGYCVLGVEGNQVDLS